MLQRSIALFALCLLSLGTHAASPSMTCGFTKKGASFDLSPLAALAKQQTGGAFTVQDRIQVYQKDYIYTFGICSSVAPPKNCLDETGKSRVRYDTAPGWQTKATDATDCKYLGNPDVTSHTWDVLDAANPAKGASLTYSGGQHCSNGQKRKLKLNFLCSSSTKEKIEQLVIDESAHCEYEINIESEYACPTQCGFSSSGSLCGAHGVCGYDTDKLQAKCFCNNGRAGAYCEEEASTDSVADYGPILGLVVFIAIGLVVVIAMLVALWRYLQHQKVTAMGDVYQSLHGGVTETFEIEHVERVELGEVVMGGEGNNVMKDTTLDDVRDQL